MQCPSARIFQEVLHRVLDKAEFPKCERGGRTRRYITFHGTRHTFASQWMYYELAEAVTGLRRGTLLSKVSRREIPHFRLGKRLVVFSRRELLAWMEQRRVAGQ